MSNFGYRILLDSFLRLVYGFSIAFCLDFEIFGSLGSRRHSESLKGLVAFRKTDLLSLFIPRKLLVKAKGTDFFS